MVLSAQHLPVANIVEATFSTPDGFGNVLHHINTDGFNSPYSDTPVVGRPRSLGLSDSRSRRSR